MKNWTRVENGWLDKKTGLIWLPKEEGEFTHAQAMKLEDGEKRLPTIGELRIAWEHGAKDVMDDWKDFWFWSSSVHPDFSYYTYALDGQYGFIHYYNRCYDFFNAVRCVSRIDGEGEE